MGTRAREDGAWADDRPGKEAGEMLSPDYRDGIGIPIEVQSHDRTASSGCLGVVSAYV